MGVWQIRLIADIYLVRCSVGRHGLELCQACCFVQLDPTEEMRAANRLLQACRITLFTRANCSLCTDAKHTLSAVWDTRPFVFREVDVMKPDQTAWRNLYEFDTPVVRHL